MTLPSIKNLVLTIQMSEKSEKMEMPVDDKNLIFMGE